MRGSYGGRRAKANALAARLDARQRKVRNAARMLKRALARLLVSRQKQHDRAVPVLEQKHVDPAAPFPNDSSCFYGSDPAGNAAIFRLAFRGPRRAAECWFDVQLAGGERVGLPVPPGREGEGFSLGPVAFVCREPGRAWDVRYRGPLVDATGREREADLELAFTSTHPLYDYAESSDRRLIADAIARERWTREFFLALKDLEQVHYEQFGRLRGRLVLDGQGRELDLLAVRDHSYGSRDWTTWDRHYWISGSTEDGEGFTAVAIRYQFCGPLYAGFVTAKDGSSDAIVGCTPLEELSRERVWPARGLLELALRSGRRRTLEFERRGVFPYEMDGAYLMREGIGAYQLDGKPAWGLCEFGFSKARYANRLD